jgi:hypothetical protein
LRNLDIFLSEFQVRALYGYYFIYAFTDPFFGVFADLMILFVTLRMFRYIFPAQRKRSRLSGIVQLGVEGLAIPLLALALFQWGLSIANLVVFLNETSAVASDALSLEYSKLSTGFSLLYLIMSGILWGNSLLLASSRWVAGMPSVSSSSSRIWRRCLADAWQIGRIELSCCNHNNYRTLHVDGYHSDKV